MDVGLIQSLLSRRRCATIEKKIARAESESVDWSPIVDIKGAMLEMPHRYSVRNDAPGLAMRSAPLDSFFLSGLHVAPGGQRIG